MQKNMKIRNKSDEFPEKREDLKEALKLIRSVLQNGGDIPGNIPGDPEEREMIREIITDIHEAQNQIYNLSVGNLDSHINLSGYLGATIKSLQANLRHLTWKTQKIAEGDLTQRVDFLGDFSLAFNTLVSSLDKSQKEQMHQAHRLQEKNINLKEGIERYRQLITLLPVPIMVVYGSSIVYANPAINLLMKVKNSELLEDQPIRNLINCQCYDVFLEKLHQSAEHNAANLLFSPTFWTDTTLLIQSNEKKIWDYFEQEILCLDGSLIICAITAMFLPFEGNNALLISMYDITEKVLLEKEMQKEGIIQIEKNMEQFQILNDQIRNPLTSILTLNEMQEGEYCEKISEQIKIIDDLVTQLDKGWIESEKVRSFLLSHYQHGVKL